MAEHQGRVAVLAMLVGAAVCGAVGGVAGLVIGLRAYPPTAWFAVLELGIPAGFAGAVLGLLAGSVVQLVAVHRARASHRDR